MVKSLVLALGPRFAHAFMALLLLFFLLLTAAPAPAQLLPAAKDSPATEETDLYGRGSPRGLSNGLLKALAAQNYERTSQYFDLGAVPAAQRAATGATIARRLQQVLDSGGSLIQPVQLSDEASGQIDDDLAPNAERIGTLPNPSGGEPVPLIATSVDQGGQTVWLISRQSLATISAASALKDGVSLRDRMPPILRETVAFGAPISDWLLLIGLGFACYAGIRLMSIGLLLGVSQLYPGHKGSWWCRALVGAPTAFSLWIGMVVFMGITRSIEASIIAKQLTTQVAGAIALLAFAWFIWRMVDLAADLIASRMQRSKRMRARSILIFLRRALKLLILLVATIQALKIIGIDVTTGIAALGLGGLAIALGAQKTVENLVGSVSVVADEPIRVGDLCKVGNVKGTVEEIGIRSTRIRTSSRTIVTIPNGNFSSLQIENFASRDKMLVSPSFRLAIDLDADEVERVLKAIRASLKKTSYLLDGATANLKDFGETWLEVEIQAWIAVTDRVTAAGHREALMLEIMRSVEAAGGRFFGVAAHEAPAAAEGEPKEKAPRRALA